MRDPAREIKGLRTIIVVLVLIILIQWSVRTPTLPVPEFVTAGEQGMIRLIVVAEPVAADDAALLRIADWLLPTMPGRAVMVQVWTDERQVPTHLMDMTDAQAAARRATVTVNLNTGLREVARPKH